MKVSVRAETAGATVGHDATTFTTLVEDLVSQRVASRVFQRDSTLWGPEAEAEASIRLGWVDACDRADEVITQVRELREAFARLSVDRVVLCGMGGSSLAPLIITRSGGVPLTVLDSTHPATVRRVIEGDLARTALVVSSKSGTTVETLSHLAAFEEAFATASIDAAERIIVVTDPGSPLAERAHESGYRVFLGDPEVGGRYSALTPFGLVPSGLAGADLASLVAEARSATAALRADTPDNPAVRLAAALAVGLPERYVCLIGESAEQAVRLGGWIEQLVAESTGKNGYGVLPMTLPLNAPELRGETPSNAVAVAIDVDERSPDVMNTVSADITVSAPLGAQLLLWEVATALLGRLIGVDPFDQPDVESAKRAARAVMSEGVGRAESRAEPLDESDVVDQLSRVLPNNGYLAIQAYLDADDEGIVERLELLRARLAAELGCPVALGFGPRYLHSTGQFHKGGPGLGVFLQLVDESPDADSQSADSRGVSEASDTFGGVDFAALIAAQARGDREVLTDRGRPVSTRAFA